MENNSGGCIIALVLFIILALVIGYASHGWSGVEAAVGILFVLGVLFVIWLLAMAG